jgi:hypothetical protein
MKKLLIALLLTSATVQADNSPEVVCRKIVTKSGIEMTICKQRNSRSKLCAVAKTKKGMLICHKGYPVDPLDD